MRRLRIILLCFTFIFYGTATTTAQDAAPAEAFVTWKSAAYAPAFYEGRILPPVGSEITASVFVLQNGKLAELAGKTIYWYLNDEFIEGGANRQTVAFRLPNGRPDTFADLMVRLPDTSGGILKTVEIPVVSPRAVIDAPFPKGVVAGPSFTVRALPYFFNIQLPGFLTYAWSVNGTSSTPENPANLTVTVGAGTDPGFPILVTLNLRNPAAYFEIGSDRAGFSLGQ